MPVSSRILSSEAMTKASRYVDKLNFKMSAYRHLSGPHSLMEISDAAYPK